MKELIKKTPILGALARRIKRELDFRFFPGSANFWESHYAAGGTSGEGSYSKFAHFKAEILNAFVRDHAVQSVIEWGSGDGNQAGLFTFPAYTGFDISDTAISLCRTRYQNDPTKQFKTVKEYTGEQAELAISLDVIYHLIEDTVFDAYMRQLFGSATRYVIVYASNTDDNSNNSAPHVRHRHFTQWVEQHCPTWNLIEHIPNRYPYNGDYTQTSFADFYIFSNGKE
jgi:hypothetical protein